MHWKLFPFLTSEILRSLCLFSFLFFLSVGVVLGAEEERNATFIDLNLAEVIVENSTINDTLSLSPGIRLEVKLDGPLYTNLTYEKLFNVINEEYVRGSGKSIDVHLQYWLLSLNDSISIVNESTPLLSLKSRKNAGTGDFSVNNVGNYQLCGSAYQENRPHVTACKNFTALSAKEIPCDLSLNTSLEKEIYNTGEKVKFKHRVMGEDFPFTITYDITNLFNETVQKEKLTKNTNKKTFTPKIEERDAVLFVRSHLSEVVCNDSNSSNDFSSARFIVKNNATLENSIEIVTVPDGEIFFGTIVRPKIKLILGEKVTTSFKLYVENSKGKRITYTHYLKPENVGSYQLTFPLKLFDNCDQKYKDGTYHISIEGFERVVTKKIVVNHKEEGCKSSTKKNAHTITSFPETVFVNSSFKTHITLENNDNRWHNYTVWSYVYRGPKSYSGYRLQNLQATHLKKGESTVIILENTVPEADEGEYKFKVQIQKDDQKTVSSIIKDLTVVPPIGEEIQEEKDGISSFYTRNTKAVDNVRLFSTIKGNGNYTVVLETVMEKQEFPLSVNESNKTSFTAEVLPGKNLYILKLLQDGTLIDVKDLVLFNDGTNISRNPLNTSGMESITGNVIEDVVQETLYESTNIKLQKMIPLFLGIVFVLLLGLGYPYLKERLRGP